MNAQSALIRRPLSTVAVVWAFLAGGVVAGTVLESRLRDMGRSDLNSPLSEAVTFLIPFFVALLVGSALAIRRPAHPVGWLFLLLVLELALSGLMDDYAAYGAVARPGSLPGAEIVAVLAVSTYLPWLMLLGLILLVTPAGRLDTRFTRTAARMTVLGVVLAVAAGLFRPYNGDLETFGQVRNPLEISGAGGPLLVLRWIGILMVHLGVIAGAWTVVMRFRAAGLRERTQLRWLGISAIPFVLLLLAMSTAAVLGQQTILTVLAGCFLAIIPLVVGLSIERHHLYDVDRLVSRAVTWVVLTAAVVGTYVVVVVFVGQSIGRRGGSTIPAVVATLAAASIAGPMRRHIQEALDRHFNRRRFETLSRLRAFTRELTPSMTIEQALRAATGDETLGVAYWIDERQSWVSEIGLPVTPAAAGVLVQRHGEPVCVVSFDEGALERLTVDVAAAEVLTELENARLRAAITLQLVEVRESRARIVEAQLAERHRIERDLHDGAQQRLLGLAMQLRAVEMGGDGDRMRTTVATAVDGLQEAVRELRGLANGLRPALLVDGGLVAALDDLAARSPVPVRLDLTSERFAQGIEEAAWFIACEAVANAVKHAAPRALTISACRAKDRLRLVIEDDGAGGADPAGSGLRGIADRAEAAGGTHVVQSLGGQGTVVIAELPCVS